MSDRYADRTYYIIGFMAILAFVLIFSVLRVQLLNSDLQSRATNTTVVENEIFPSRGLIKDRNDKLIVLNKNIYDVYVTYENLSKEAKLPVVAKFLNVAEKELEEKINKDWSDYRYSKTVPFLLYENVPDTIAEAFAESLHLFPGFEVRVKNNRGYASAAAPHLIGYMGEADEDDIGKDAFYKSGNLLGETGIERFYEKQLRGVKGKTFDLKDNLGRVVDRYAEGAQDIAAQSGDDISLTIDIALQEYAKLLMNNKKGGIVAIEPSSGEILAILSTPSFDLNDLAIGGNRSETFSQLMQDTLKPFFDRSIMAHYPPGSLFKPLLALIGLQEGTITSDTRIRCRGGFFYKQFKWGCHADPGISNVQKAISESCNTFFYTVYQQLIEKFGYDKPEKGLQLIVDYLKEFGIGEKPQIDIGLAASGFNPDPLYYDKLYRNKGDWRSTYLLSNAIGQGELELTTLQMAQMATIIANRGTFKAPHLVKKFMQNDKITNLPRYPEKTVSIDAQHFDVVINGMFDAVKKGTARASYIPGIDLCGKTGTSENSHGEDHSVFMGFAPKVNPKIAIAVFIENGGWGGSYAAPIGSLIIEKFINGNIDSKRKWLENNMLKANLLDNKS